MKAVIDTNILVDYLRGILDTILVTRNSRDFPADHPGIRIPYRV